MGNGPRITVAKSDAFTLNDLEKAADQAANSFGNAASIFMNAQVFMQMNQVFMGGYHPELNPTPWADIYKLTKREYRVAVMHTFLSRLKALNKFSDDDWEEVKNISVKRLKRAKWARYQK